MLEKWLYIFFLLRDESNSFFLYLAVPPCKQLSIFGPLPFSVDIVYNIILHRATEFDKTEDRQPPQGSFTAGALSSSWRGRRLHLTIESQRARP